MPQQHFMCWECNDYFPDETLTERNGTDYCPSCLPTGTPCPYCQEPVEQLPPDAVDYCPQCEVITEGQRPNGPKPERTNQ